MFHFITLQDCVWVVYCSSLIYFLNLYFRLCCRLLFDVGVSNFKLSHPFVNKAFEKYDTGFKEDEEYEEHLRIEVEK